MSPEWFDEAPSNLRLFLNLVALEQLDMEKFTVGSLPVEVFFSSCTFVTRIEPEKVGQENRDLFFEQTHKNIHI